ncbi:turripeptide Pal9.2-like [Hermetia illucens]|uniref:turripeptide Pal9.2-like n=1 Tax=Hermetia illucens TaxID=343691 RepID=UPI0018CC3A1C|nr:turripeptide Pal9.2-like [Hermetia illucens]
MKFVLLFVAITVIVKVAAEVKCDPRCARILSPVCGLNSRKEEKTFPNKCVLKLVNCEEKEDYVIIHKGVCKEVPQPTSRRTTVATEGNRTTTPASLPR